MDDKYKQSYTFSGPVRREGSVVVEGGDVIGCKASAGARMINGQSYIQTFRAGLLYKSWKGFGSFTLCKVRTYIPVCHH